MYTKLFYQLVRPELVLKLSVAKNEDNSEVTECGIKFFVSGMRYQE